MTISGHIGKVFYNKEPGNRLSITLLDSLPHCWNIKLGIAPDVQIGNHCIISSNAVIGSNTIIEDFVNIGANSTIGSNVLIGRGSEISANIHIPAEETIAKDSYIETTIPVQ